MLYVVRHCALIIPLWFFTSRGPQCRVIVLEWRNCLAGRPTLTSVRVRVECQWMISLLWSWPLTIFFIMLFKMLESKYIWFYTMTVFWHQVTSCLFTNCRSGYKADNIYTVYCIYICSYVLTMLHVFIIHIFQNE